MIFVEDQCHDSLRHDGPFGVFLKNVANVKTLLDIAALNQHFILSAYSAVLVIDNVLPSGDMQLTKRINVACKNISSLLIITLKMIYFMPFINYMSKTQFFNHIEKSQIMSGLMLEL